MFPTTPPSVQQTIQRVTNLLNAGQVAAAETELADLTRLAPNSVDTFRLRGQLRSMQGRIQEAERAFHAAFRLAPRDVPLLLAIAQFHYRVGRFQVMMEVLEEALKIQPGNPSVIGMMARARRRQGQPKLALKLLERIPDSPVSAITAAWAHYDLGEWEQALKAIHSICEGPDAGAINRYQAFQIRGLSLERLGRYDAAMVSYITAKQAVPLQYDFQQYTQWVRSAGEVYSEAAWPSMARSSNTSEIPVFIVALPRSGTTLLEAIISSHPQAADAGELEVVRRMVGEIMKQELADSWPRVAPTYLTSEVLDRWAARYLEASTSFGPSALRIVDKNLLNWVYVGLLAQMFPKARFIHIDRDPLDVGISCFERLPAVVVPWSADLIQLGTVIRIYRELMEHWKRLLPGRIHTVQYEQLVRNQEGEMRKILDFLGLPWDPAVLAHHHSKDRGGSEGRQAPLPTLGSEQASKPVYDSSIGRGARFGAALDPLRKAIAGEV